jgi:hypothetical protein
MYDRGAGDGMGSSQGALREHIVEKAYEIGLSGHLPEHWKIREAGPLTFREAVRSVAPQYGSDPALAAFMAEGEDDQRIHEAARPRVNLLGEMGIREEDI